MPKVSPVTVSNVLSSRLLRLMMIYYEDYTKKEENQCKMIGCRNPVELHFIKKNPEEKNFHFNGFRSCKKCYEDDYERPKNSELHVNNMWDKVMIISKEEYLVYKILNL